MNYGKMTRSDLIKELKPLKSSMEIAERKQTEKELKRLGNTLEQNVAKYKKVEKEFRMSQSRFSRIFNSNMMGIAFWDTSGEITHANDAFLNIVGYTRRDLQSGKVNWLRMTPREHAHLDRKGIEEVKTRGFCTPFEKEYIRKDGKRVPILIGGASIEGNGKIGITYVIDMTGYKRAEEALAERARLGELGADIGVALTQEKTLQKMMQHCCEAMVKHLGAAFARLWMLNKEENVLELQASAGVYTHMDGSPRSPIPVGKYAVGFIAKRRQPYQTNKVIGNPRILNQEWAKREGLVSFAGHPLIVENRVIGIMVIFSREPLKEITLKALASVADELAIGIHRKQMEENLLRSEKMKALGEITAGIAHEFNNILAIISGNAQLLEENFRGGKELRDCLSTIRRVAYDGTKILSRMYKSADIKPDISGNVRVNMRELLNQAIDFTMPRWKNMAQAEGITYKLNRKGLKKVPAIQGNPSELREVLVNIINNALDAMADGGSISFRTWSKKESVFISISDTGKGMTEAVKKKVFDPFFTTKRPQGTGLGLSVSYGIIRRHEGNIDVGSKVGKGSTFTLRLPIKKRSTRSKVSSKPTRKKKVKNLKILVVDDVHEIAEVLSKFLSKEGHNVKSVDSGDKAIKLLKSKDFDLVLCDLVMPGINGSDVIKALDTLEKRPKVGLVTGWSEEFKAKKKEDLKVDFIVRKPFDFSELSRNINDTLSLY